MARLPRLTVPGYPHHVIQRGNNRQAIVVTQQDRAHLLALIAESAEKFLVDVHAYVLMDNHFHLLLTPSDGNGLSLMMQAVGRSYVRYFNHARQRTGTLWEGRYKSTVIQTERYLLACMAYVDLNPVRAKICERPSDFPWSSYRHYAGLNHDKLLKPHPVYWGLGNTPFARELAYKETVAAGLSLAQERALTDATLHGWALGDEHFVRDLQGGVERRLAKGKAGRPRKTPREGE